MIPLRALRETITIYRRTYPGGSGSGEGGTDRYGNPIAEEDDGTEAPAAVQPFRLQNEELGGRDMTETRYKVLVAPDVLVDAVARVVWHGQSYEVHGEPVLFSTASGPHHYELILRLIEGA